MEIAPADQAADGFRLHFPFQRKAEKPRQRRGPPQVGVIDFQVFGAFEAEAERTHRPVGFAAIELDFRLGEVAVMQQLGVATALSERQQGPHSLSRGLLLAKLGTYVDHNEAHHYVTPRGRSRAQHFEAGRPLLFGFDQTATQIILGGHETVIIAEGRFATDVGALGDLRRDSRTLVQVARVMMAAAQRIQHGRHEPADPELPCQAQRSLGCVHAVAVVPQQAVMIGQGKDIPQPIHDRYPGRGENPAQPLQQHQANRRQGHEDQIVQAINANEELGGDVTRLLRQGEGALAPYIEIGMPRPAVSKAREHAGRHLTLEVLGRKRRIAMRQIGEGVEPAIQSVLISGELREITNNGCPGCEDADAVSTLIELLVAPHQRCERAVGVAKETRNAQPVAEPWVVIENRTGNLREP